MDNSTGHQLDAMRLNRYIEEIRTNQNLGMGILGGAVGAMVGAGLWGLITYLTGFQIGWMAVGVGFLVGYLVRSFGKGIDKKFGISGAVLSLLGCAMGNLFTVCIVIAKTKNMALLDVIGQLDSGKITTIFTTTFNPMDILFYAIAVYEGYRFSFYRITKEELARFVK